MSLIYIGAFPPGWGGVTIKNRDLYDALVAEGIIINKVDLHLITRQNNIREVFRLISAVLGRSNRYVIGISTGMRKRFTKALYFLNRNSMHKSIMIVMGGTAARDMIGDPVFMRLASEYRKIFVETESMVKDLESKGMKNVALYPNCRHRSMIPYKSRKKGNVLRCVFFSYIQPQKGVDIILDVAEKMLSIEFVFYGNIDPTYTEKFQKRIEVLPNCSHRGIFKGSNEEVYKELKQYDLMLFPTKWETEGVPGILVEAKVAGLPCIVSNKSFNGELVLDGKEGIVLAKNNVENLMHAILKLDQDRELLQRLSDGSYQSAERFYIEHYIHTICDELR